MAKTPTIALWVQVAGIPDTPPPGWLEGPSD